MKSVLALVLFTWLEFSCQKEASPVVIDNGNYTVYINATLLKPNPSVCIFGSQLDMTFRDGVFSESNRYANGVVTKTCKGTYQVSGQEINFTNECLPDTNTSIDLFGNLVLSGRFKLQVKDNTVLMIRQDDTSITQLSLIKK